MNPHKSILVAGIGNIFLADDGFGVAVVQRLSAGSLPAGVDVVDFGIRGFDLAMTICRDYAVIILVDAAPHGDPPGTLRQVEIHPDHTTPDDCAAAPQMHRLDPVAAIQLARRMGAELPPIHLVCCEPATLEGFELSRHVRAAVPEAARWVERLLDQFQNGEAESCMNSA